MFTIHTLLHRRSSLHTHTTPSLHTHTTPSLHTHTTPSLPPYTHTTPSLPTHTHTHTQPSDTSSRHIVQTSRTKSWKSTLTTHSCCLCPRARSWVVLSGSCDPHHHLFFFFGCSSHQPVSTPSLSPVKLISCGS